MLLLTDGFSSRMRYTKCTGATSSLDQSIKERNLAGNMPLLGPLVKDGDRQYQQSRCTFFGRFSGLAACASYVEALQERAARSSPFVNEDSAHDG